VWLEDGVLHWRMSFDRFKQIKMMPAFEGEVLPMGRTLLLVGAHQDPLHKVVRADGREAPLVERGRSLALFEDTHRTNLKDVRFGLLTSTMSAAPYLPCTACVVLVKVPGVDANDRAKVDEVIRTVTKIESWEKIVLEDFKTEDPDDPIWISAFLDNRVAGSITAPRGKKNGSLQEEIDRKLAEWQRPRMDERRDQTLKIDIQRFYERMPKIVDRVRKHAGNAAPFK
jgi:hypothetical protein